ncbi:MAG: hypothetical protein SGJ27_01905 [Candidatus Melainabacteria bacterium]|nr:hypothetical protein [Candidatus Melainabacteria bacterium]
MNIWDEIFYGALDNDINYSSPDRSPQPTSTQPAYSEAARNLFMAAAKDESLPNLLRNILQSDWYVPGDSAESLQTIVVKPGEYRLVLEPSRIKKNKKSKANLTAAKDAQNGIGGKLLPLYAVAPETPPFVLVNGRTLFGRGSAGADGLLVHVNDETPFEIGRHHFDLMASLAEQCDLEEVIVSPGPDQVAKLMAATWWVEGNAEEEENQVTAKTVINDCRVAWAHTGPDRSGLAGFRRQITGENLFRGVINNPAADGIVVNEKLGIGDTAMFNPVFSLECIQEMLKGNDLRIGVKPLPARTLTEIEQWLRCRSFPYQNRRYIDASYDGEALVRVMVPEGHDWNMNESLGNQCRRKPTWSPVFSLPPVETRTQSGFGDGISAILCPGLLARDLNASAYPDGADPKKYWKWGRNLLFGRLLDKKDISMSKERLALARELEKMLPEGADCIPRGMMRTVEGAAFLRKHPHGGTRIWIEGTVKQAERYTKTWVPA